MNFKKYEYYDDILDNIKGLKVVNLGCINILDYKSQRTYPTQDVSFAYILDYIITINQINANNKNSNYNKSNVSIQYDTYEKLCKFFNQDTSKVTLNNLFDYFKLTNNYFSQNNLHTFKIAFDSLKKEKINERTL
ncbi:MAG: hypothetical protein ACI4TX_01320 [Christensenellales bacterium]